MNVSLGKTYNTKFIGAKVYFKALHISPKFYSVTYAVHKLIQK